MAPRLVTIRRVAKGRLRARSAKAKLAAVRARATVTCTRQPDGSLRIRVKSARGIPLRKIVGPRLRIGFVRGLGPKSGPIKVRFGRP